MKITHDTFGEIDGVEGPYAQDTMHERWVYRSAWYCKSEGWREVPEKHWVRVNPQGMELRVVSKGPDVRRLRLELVELYEIPEAVLSRSSHSVYDFLQRYKHPYLIVEELK